MPQITEIMDTAGHPAIMNESTESSLQVSSSSPDVVPGRALQVQTVATVPSRSESSSTSRQSRDTPEPARRNRSRDSPYGQVSRRASVSRSHSGSTSHQSHRGPGTLAGGGLPTGMEVDQRSVHQHLNHHEVDQRSVHQHLHQHRHDQRLMQVQVGVDPEAVIQRLQEAERQTQTVISEARSER